MSDSARVCVIGGGLAGALLAWRLAARPEQAVDLVLGDNGAADATEASGGAVRAYEPLPAQRELAIESLLDLLDSTVLQDWAGYRQTGFTYIREVATGVADEAADVARCWPGAVQVVPGPELAARGFAGLPVDSTAVVERYGGYISPGRLRRAVVADIAGRRVVTPLDGSVSSIAPGPDGSTRATVAGQSRRYDVVVVAAGAWTPFVLRANGLPAHGYRTKSIQYGIYPVAGQPPPAFTDETTGLYGKPTSDGDLLLGYPTDEWGAPPGRPPVTPAVHERAAELARQRFPAMRLGPARRYLSATDCYTDPPLLALRPVLDTGVFTFTGGSGAAAKTALAASARAAARLQGLRTSADTTHR